MGEDIPKQTGWYYYGHKLSGTDTVSTFLEWSLYYMVAFPEVHDRLQEEIKVVGDAKPTLEDRRSTPYVEAFVEEVMRFCPLTFFAMPHATADDTMLCWRGISARRTPWYRNNCFYGLLVENLSNFTMLLFS